MAEQVDRIEAGECFDMARQGYLDGNRSAIAQAMIDGKADDSFLVRAFARRREQAQAEAYERAAKHLDWKAARYRSRADEADASNDGETAMQRRECAMACEYAASEIRRQDLRALAKQPESAGIGEEG